MYDTFIGKIKSFYQPPKWLRYYCLNLSLLPPFSYVLILSPQNKQTVCFLKSSVKIDDLIWKNYEPLRTAHSFSGLKSVCAEYFFLYPLPNPFFCYYAEQEGSYLYITCSSKIYISYLYAPVDWLLWKVVLTFTYTSVSFAFFFLLIVLWITNRHTCGSQTDLHRQQLWVHRSAFSIRKKRNPTKTWSPYWIWSVEDLIFGIERRCVSHHAWSRLEAIILRKLKKDFLKQNL